MRLSASLDACSGSREIAIKHDMPYFLIWANFHPSNCYVPYKYNEELGHELSDEFINFYNSDKSIFADTVNFYPEAKQSK